MCPKQGRGKERVSGGGGGATGRGKPTAIGSNGGGVEKELEQMLRERTAAAACGYDFVVGVSTQAHKDALLEADSSLNVVVTGCKR
ncbi:hypothetical protein F0U61_33365 [Archangium violaceum]|uniref:DUF6310 domain-containing protein n=1 Tax=Archangium violaceum TaxID=83451 RepID=UPI002B2853B6|nr:hypothetical protein F0U61_33365 [Archangium violaceum]